MKYQKEYLKLYISLAINIIIFQTISLGETPGNIKKFPEAVKEVLEGTRTIANAAWWGFDENDATEALQSAINSGAKRVIVPNMTKDWIVRPINLAGDQELIFEDGVVVTAKRGEFQGGGDCLFRATNISNLTIRGYGAIFRMQKKDYIQRGIYEQAEWRMTLKLDGTDNVKVYGITMKNSGGDGIYFGAPYVRNTHIKDCVFDNHHRQGISIITAENLIIENCILKNTWGTPPSAGIDIEPNNPNEILVNILIRNCLFQDNYGPGILLYLANLSTETPDISINFDGCSITSNTGSGIIVAGIKDDGPKGLIEFKNCVTENTEKQGLSIYDKSTENTHVRFTNCTWRNVGLNIKNNEFLRGNIDSDAPLVLYLRRPNTTKKYGGVEFIDCSVEDTINRPFIAAREKESKYGVYDISGTIKVRNPYGAIMDLGAKTHNVNLKVIEER